ncbi:MAG: cytochrome-c peroxidase, partial [Gallionellaceae bacterium]|nr:cytochrome-c peroxidase [Gallionellaceae bacterium]
MSAAFVTALILYGVGWLYPGWHASSGVALDPNRAQTNVAADVFTPLPLKMALDERKVKLGERLFRDQSLSSDGSVSCSSCHNLDTGGVDRLPRSRGIGGRVGRINAPTVYNSGFNFRQFWDGRAASLEDQVDGPLQNSVEMANTWPQALATISADAQYR